jgi:WD40 repeat protein/tetratricopeptide (TPR) repeat protein
MTVSHSAGPDSSAALPTRPEPPPGPGTTAGLPAPVPPGARPGQETTTEAPRPATDTGPAAPPPGAATPAAGQAPAGYEILGELGRGGMGVVYQARQVRLQRLVALKMILAGGHAGEEALARFRTEAEAVARLQHPGVVQVYEVGEWRANDSSPPLPFLALEFCPGGSLDKKLAGNPQPPQEAAALVEKLARALAAAHQKGVIHRDLKPANVLLAEDGTPKITDFGLAKKLDEAGQTQTGAIMGTPSYMAPEQAGGSSKEIGPAADVWALGATLYDCLTGHPPFKAATPMDTVLQVLTEEPVPPSRLLPHCPRDLETVCLKCLQKDPRRRYAGAEALAEDLRRFQEGRPIAARPVGQIERAWRWCRRNPVIASLLATVAATLLLGATVAALLALAAHAAADRARENEQWALQQKGEAEDARAEAVKDKKRADDEARRAVAEKEQKDRQLTRAEWLLYAEQIDRAHQAWREGNQPTARAFLDRTRWDYRGWEHRFLRGLASNPLTLKGHADAVYSVCFSPDGKRLASAGGDLGDPDKPGEVKVRDADTGQELLSLRRLGGWVWSVCFSPDGTRLATAGFDRTVRLWDARTGEEVLALKGHQGPVNDLCFSPDGTRLASCSAPDRTARVWDVSMSTQGRQAGSTKGRQAAAREVLSLKGHADQFISVAFSPDGTRLATSGGTWDPKGKPSPSEIKVWDARTGQELLTLTGQTAIARSVCFSPDGSRIASASGEPHDPPQPGELKVWDARTGKELLSLRGHTQPVTGVCFSPDGQRLASSGHDATVRLWDAHTGQELHTFKGHTNMVNCVCFSPDGRRLASAGEESNRELHPLPGEVKVWDAGGGEGTLALVGHTTEVGRVCFDPSGRRVAATAVDGTLRLWDAQTGEPLRAFKAHAGRVHDVCFSPDGRRLATAGHDRTVKVWSAQTGNEVLSIRGHEGPVWSVCFSPDGTRLASAGTGLLDLGGEAKVWDARTGQQLFSLPGLKGWATSVCFSPDGRRLAAGCQDQTVRVWDLQTRAESMTLKGHTKGVTTVCFSPDGRLLASGSWDQTVRVWDAGTGKELMTLRGHTGVVSEVCFGPGGDNPRALGQRLASASVDGMVRLWEAQTGQTVFTLRGDPVGLYGVGFSPDGKQLAVCGSEHAVKVFEAPGPEQVRPLQDPPAAADRVGFSPDGHRVVAAGPQGAVACWDTHTGQPVVPCPDPAPPRQRQAASPDGQLLAQIDDRQVFIRPRIVQAEDSSLRRLEDPGRQYVRHARLAEEARAGKDEFALHYHLRPLLRTGFLRWHGQPFATFPTWAFRPPVGLPGSGSAGLSRTAAKRLEVTAAELRRLHDELSRDVGAAPQAWESWAARGWCRHLLGDFPGASADLRKSIELHSDEPGLWAVLGTVCLKHGRLAEAEVARARLAAWKGLDVDVWHALEADACEGEGDAVSSYWHLNYLTAPTGRQLVRRGLLTVEQPAPAVGPSGWSERHRRAAADFARAVQLNDKDWPARISQAWLCLALNDLPGYRRCCTALLTDYNPKQDPAHVAADVARTAMLAPEAAPDLEAALKLLPTDDQDRATQVTRGGLLLRAGKFTEAVAELEKAAAGRPVGEPPVAELLLAIALHRQGKQAEARRTLEQARLALDFALTEGTVRQGLHQFGGGMSGPLTAAVAAGTRAASPPRWPWVAQLEVRLLRHEAHALIDPPASGKLPEATTLEAEDLLVVASQDCWTRVQDMTGWLPLRWGNGKQLFCGAARGGFVELRVALPEPGHYDLELHLTRAPDFGIVEVALDGRVIGQPFDGYAESVRPSGAVVLGRVDLDPGPHWLRFTAVGKNARATSYHMGIDALVFRAAK